MRKILLMILLTVVSGSAVAGWVIVASSDHENVYANPATIRKVGNRVNMWTMRDYKTPEVTENGKRSMSSKTRNEYDCKEERSRILALYMYTENMGRGEVVYLLNFTDEWVAIPPDSLMESMWEFACKKR